MRRLAQHFSVDPMSLYHHVRDKDDLLGAMVDAVVSGIDAQLPDAAWSARMRTLILAARAAVLQHPWSARLLEDRAEPTPAGLLHMNTVVGIMREGGFTLDLAHHALHVLGSRVLGFSQDLFDDAPDVRPEPAVRQRRRRCGWSRSPTSPNSRWRPVTRATSAGATTTTSSRSRSTSSSTGSSGSASKAERRPTWTNGCHGEHTGRMPKPPDPSPVPPPSVRAQLLATEHWGLLAARGTAQSEVLTRITIFLTLFSAGLVSIALIGQATDFAGLFGPSAIAVLVIIAIVGQLTQVRVLSVGMEDLMYVLAMNRMRAAYLALDPGIEPYLMASAHDDLAGSHRTYDFFGKRTDGVQVMGSTMVLIIIVNAMLLGLLGAAICVTLGAAGWVFLVVGGVIALAYVAVSIALGERTYRSTWVDYRPVNPSGSTPVA